MALRAALALLAACGTSTRLTETSTSTRLTETSTSTRLTETSTRLTETSEERLLEETGLRSLSPARGPVVRRGTFDATLDRGTASLEIARTEDPSAYRGPLAFFRLSRAVGARVVPATVLRHLSAGDLATLLSGSPEGMALLREARVLNDGTIDALLTARAPAHAGPVWEPLQAVAVDPERGPEASKWAGWARSPVSVPGEDTGLLRDYVELLVLDYLAANVARRSVLLAGSALVLADNASAFPPHPEASVLNRMLRRLRATERFPRGMREALLGFDRDRAAAAFADGGSSTGLLAPRVRVELDERRATILTLIEAKIGERGRDAVLCL